MYCIDYTKRFEKDLKSSRSGGWTFTTHDTVALLAATGKLPTQYRPHKLLGNKTIIVTKCGVHLCSRFLEKRAKANATNE